MSDQAAKLRDLERLGELVSAIMGLDPDVHRRCRGRPGECGDACQQNTCPLQNNRLQDLGEMVAGVLEEFEWHRAWATELQALRVVPEGTLDRVDLRVKQARLRKQLRAALAAKDTVQGVQVLLEQFVSSIAELRADIEAIDQQLGDEEGAKA